MASNNCSAIVNGVVANQCCIPSVPGVLGDVTLINWNDVDRAGSTISADGVISVLLLKTGKKAYRFDMLDNSTEGNISYNKGTYFGSWQHDVSLRFFVRSDEAKSFLNKMPCGRIVAIVHNRDGGLDKNQWFEVYGWDSGLELNEVTGSTTMPDGVVYDVTVGSGDTSKEAAVPKTLDYGSEADTEKAIDSLVA